MPDPQTLILLPSECAGGCRPDQQPWQPANGSQVSIRNNSGSRQMLCILDNGLLTQPGSGSVRSIALAVNGVWTGRVGNARGNYMYDDGCDDETDLSTRTGTIDPS